MKKVSLLELSVQNNVNYYHAKYNGQAKIDGEKNKYITDHPDFENARELKKEANKFKYDLPNKTIASYFSEYKEFLEWVS